VRLGLSRGALGLKLEPLEAARLSQAG